MGKVLVFGTFDDIHKGHLEFLKQAKEKGEHLTIVIARDETVKRLKGAYPIKREDERLKEVRLIGIADDVKLGDLIDPYKIISEIKPDVICLGYDQSSFTDNLAKEIENKHLDIKIIKLKPYKPEEYHSSIIKKNARYKQNKGQ